MAERLTQDPRLWRVLLVASIAMFAINVDFFAVQATLPPMAEDLDTTVTSLQWVISGYMLALASFLIVGGRLADIFGRRTFVLIGAVIFGLASLGAGLASFPEMVIFMRIVQGLGAAIMMPVSIAVVTNAFPPDKTQRAVGLVFAIAAIGQALGPLIGGTLTEWASWRWVLWVNIPVVVALVVLTLTSVEESRDETVPRSIDWTGLLLVVVSIATVTFGIDKAADWGWTAPSTIGLIVGGVVGLVLFVLNEVRTAYPILDLGLFGIRAFSLTVAGGSVGNMAIVTTIFLSMIWLQNVEGYTTLEAGMMFLGFSLAITIVDQFAGRLGRFPSWAVMAAALLVGGVGTTGMGVVNYLAPFIALSVLSGAGLGLAWAFASVVTQDVVLPQKAGEASGTVLTVLIGLGGVAIAVASSLVTTTGSDPSDLGTAVDGALMVFGLMAVVASPIVAVVGRGFDRAELVAVDRG